jgi:hypothetical protein
MQATDRVRLLSGPYVQGLIAAVVLMAYALVNGYGLFYNDTRSYVRGPALAAKALLHREVAPEWRSRTDMVTYQIAPAVETAAPAPASPDAAAAAAQPAQEAQAGYTANRSIYYGVLALVGYLTSDFWLTIFLQALALAIPCAIIALRGFGLKASQWLLVAAALAVATTIGPIAALIMPDVFAPVVILGTAALFVFWDRLKRLDVVVLFLLVVFAVLAHLSHLVLLAALVVLLTGYWFWRRPVGASPKALGILAAAVVAGLAGQVAYSKALEMVTHRKPLVLPHITAHLQSTKPGYAYLKANCPQVGLAVCRYLDRLPQHWTDFLGADPKRGVFPSADPATQRRLADEQERYALGVLRTDPVGLAGSLAGDGLRQLVQFSLADLEVTPAAKLNYEASFPGNVASQIEGSQAGRSPTLLRALSTVSYVAVLASLAGLAWFAARPGVLGATPDVARRYWLTAVIMVGGVLLNGVICGVLASPYDRFQSRVVWLAPFVALMGLMLRRRSRET